jgi:hypothetical protein
VALLLLAGCAPGQKAGGHTEAIEGHVYALPLDAVLPQATALLSERGWRVERSGDQLGTNWRLDSSGEALGYRVEGTRIDEGHCSIQVELLAATSFAPPPSSGATNPSGNLSGTPMYARDSSGGSGASGGRSTGWDGVDAPTTLGESPPGLVTLPRGRDEALEWALLQRLDPRSAQAIAHAEARRKSAAATPSAAPVASAAPPPPAACLPTPSGLEAALAERRLILLSDVPGTNEIPDFVGRLACQAALQGIPTLVALELFRVDQTWVDTYFASQGKAEDRTAFLQVARSFDRQASGVRGSAAVLRLLDTLRTLRDAGLSLRIVAFDDSSPESKRARAVTLERVRRAQPEALLLVVVQRAEAQTLLPPDVATAEAPLGWTLSHWGLQPLSLDVHSPGGQAWSCPAVEGRCTPVSIPRTAAPAPGDWPSIEVYAAPDRQGFGGAYAVGPLTASAPPH